MRLRHVKIKNFRCLAEVNVPIGDTVVLLGENNAGKTAFLAAVGKALPRAFTMKGHPFEELDYSIRNAGDTAQSSAGIEIELWFREDHPHEWPVTLVQALNDIAQYDAAASLNAIGFRVQSKYDDTVNQFVTTWHFLAIDGQPMPRVSREPLIRRFLQYVRLFYLSALRDSDVEFSPRSQFWGRIMRDLHITPEQRRTLTEELARINDVLLRADARIEGVRTTLEGAQRVLGATTGGRVSIQAMPTSAADLLGKSQVVMKAAGADIELPLDRHGQGVQSLAVLFLFQAFIEVLLKPTFEPETDAILALEEPEAHLHPNAIRTLAKHFGALNAQKIVSTHSPYILQGINFEQIRYFRRTGATTEIRHTGLFPSGHHLHLTADELQSLETFVKRTRGDILFCRAWLLCEGQSEFVVLRYFADVLDRSLDQLSVAIVDFQNNGSPGAFAKLAEVFGIPWIMVTDADDAFSGFKDQIDALQLPPADLADRLRPLPTAGLDFEHFLYQNGFKDEYLEILFAEAQAKTAGNTPPHWTIATKRLNKDQYRVVSDAQGNRHIDYLPQGAATNVIKPGDPNFDELLEAAVLQRVQTEKVTYAYRLVNLLEQKHIQAARIPAFLQQAIEDVVRKAQ